MKVPKLLDRVISQRRDRRAARNQAAAAAFAREHLQDEAGIVEAEGPNGELHSSGPEGRLVSVHEEKGTVAESKSDLQRLESQEQQLSLTLISRNAQQANAPLFPLKSEETAPVEAEAVLLTHTNHHKEFASDKDDVLLSHEASSSKNGVKRYTLIEDSLDALAKLPELELKPISRRGAQTLKGRSRFLNAASISHTFSGERSSPILGEQRRQEDDNQEALSDAQGENDDLSHLSSSGLLCEVCQIIIREYPKTEWYASVIATTHSIKMQASRGCPLCSLYFEMVVSNSDNKSATDMSIHKTGKTLPDYSTTDMEACELVYKRDAGSKLVLNYHSHKYTVVLDWKCSGAKFLSARSLYPARWNLPQEKVFPELLNCSWGIVREWLRKCAGHRSCQANRKGLKFIPTRLIHIHEATTDFPPRLRLCNGSGVEPSAKYMTLSHCWGKTKYTTLSKENLHVMQNMIRFENLSKTFQDSILVTQHLGIKYLWIDSLCIIQDSPEDWRQESSLMGDVYSFSYCNISAAAAADGSGGLFPEKRLDDFQITRLAMPPRRHAPLRNCHAHDSEFFMKSIDKTTSAKRGWVLQERLLSRCNLHFGAKQVLWECREQTACETMPDGLVSGISRPSLKDTVSRMRGFKLEHLHGDRIDLWVYDRWADIIHAYTEALLTRQTDRLVAVSGLASIFQSFYGTHLQTQPEYLAGIWAERRHFSTQLLWYAKQVRSIPDSNAAFVAPTWSCASIDASIGDIFNFSRTCVEMVTFAFPYASTTLINARDIFGQVSSGTLSLRGKLARASYTALPSVTPRGISLPPHGILKILEYRPPENFSWYINDIKSSTIIQTKVWWDRLFSPGSTVASGRLYLLPIRAEALQDESFMEGLILEPVSPDAFIASTASKMLSLVPSKFRRVGKWTACNYASVLRVRAGCRFFDMHGSKEEGNKDPLGNDYDVWSGKMYDIDIV